MPTPNTTRIRYVVEVELPGDVDVETVHPDPDDGPMNRADMMGDSIRMAILHGAACESWPVYTVTVGPPVIDRIDKTYVSIPERPEFQL